MLSITPSKKFCIIKSVSSMVKSISLSIQISHNEVSIHKDDRRPTCSLLYICLFVCLFALSPKSTAMVIAGRSVHLTTLFLGRLEQAVNQ